MSNGDAFELLERLLAEMPRRFAPGKDIADGPEVLSAYLQWRMDFYQACSPERIKSLLDALRDEEARHISTLSELHITRTLLAAQENTLSAMKARVDAALPAEGKDDA